MDGDDGIVRAHRPAAVDHFLAAALHFRVAALHGGEVQVFRLAAGGDRGGRAAAQADQHGRAAEHDQQIALGNHVLLHVIGADIAETAGDHDRLVVTAQLAAFRRRGFQLEGAEIAADVGPAELVVEGGGAERAFDHDVQRGGDAVGLAVILLPGLLGAGDAQVGDGEATESSLRLAAAPGRALIADLAARAGRRAGEG